MAVERHPAAAHGRHIFHPAHKFVLRDDYRLLFFVQRFEDHVEVHFVILRKLCIEYRTQQILLYGRKGHLPFGLLLDQFIDHVRIDTCETCSLVFAFEPADEMVIQLAVHLQYVVAALLRFGDKTVLSLLVRSIEVDYIAVLVGLALFDQCGVFAQREIFLVDIFQQYEIRGFLCKLLVGNDAVLDEYFEAVPLVFVIGALLFEYFVEPIGHFAGDVARNFLHIRIALQITARYVQRDIRRVDHAVEQRQEFRHDSLHRIGDEHLVRVKLDFVLLDLEVVADFREIEDTRQVERVVDVQVDVEQRLLGHRVEFAVELQVLFRSDVGRFLRPQRFDVVNDVVFVRVDIFAVFPLLDLAEGNGNGQETAMLFQNLADAGRVVEFEAVFREVQDNVRSAVTLFFSLLHRVFGRSVAAPFHRFGVFLVGAGDDFDFVGHHECRIEPQSEVTDDTLVLVFLEELFGA